MKPARKKRLLILLIILLGISCASALVLYALKQNINLYYTPTQIKQTHLSDVQVFRIGGMVVKNSVQHNPHTLQVTFVLTDFKNSITVNYDGILPALFREGQGIVAQGHLNAKGIFVAAQVLAKHDEKYMPPGIKVEKR